MRTEGVISLLAVAAMAAAPASAATFNFSPLGTNPPGLAVEASITFADGFLPFGGSKLGPGFPGILSFLFKVNSFEVNLDNLVAVQSGCADPNSFPCIDSTLDYQFGPNAGWIYYNDTGSDFRFEYAGAAALGFFNSDNPAFAPCDETGTCTFRGSWTAVAEPAGLALLLAAIGIGAGTRLRRRDT